MTVASKLSWSNNFSCTFLKFEVSGLISDCTGWSVERKSRCTLVLLTLVTIHYLFIYFKDLFIYFVYIQCSVCMFGFKPEEGIGYYRWLWTAMWLLGIEVRASGRTVSVPNNWVISSVPLSNYLCQRRKGLMSAEKCFKAMLIASQWISGSVFSSESAAVGQFVGNGNCIYWVIRNSLAKAP